MITVSRISLAPIAILLLLLTINVSSVAAQTPDWNVGSLIGLRAGVCIREGPGLRYRAHTQVPEDNWTVMVIDGPRQANGRLWYDTSRRAAGDPSGGTGWVMADWSDTDCVSQPAPPAVPSINPPPAPPSNTSWGQNLQELRAWWESQPDTVKWLIAIALLVLIVLVWQRVASSLLTLVLAIFGGLVIWWFLDQTRPGWQATWDGLVGVNAPDLAIVFAMIPLVVWLLALLRGRST
jgi:hypothetical protein